MAKITIAIDGYSSTGKSTIAKRLAQSLDYLYVDTGAMYRAVTLYAIENKLIDGNKVAPQLINYLPKLVLSFELNSESGKSEICLNGKNVASEIRTLEVSTWVSQVSAIAEVREKLVALQKEMGKEKGVVMDGRDIGTVVFPDAELKIFMTASPTKRATRRYKELLDKGEQVTYAQVLENIQLRDHLDATRKASPLQKAPDAILLDNSDMGIEEQFERILSLAHMLIKE